MCVCVFAPVCFNTCERICELARNFDFANWRLYNDDAERFILEDILVTAQSFFFSPFVESTIAVFFVFFDTLTARFEKYERFFFFHLTEEVLVAKLYKKFA